MVTMNSELAASYPAWSADTFPSQPVRSSGESITVKRESPAIACLMSARVSSVDESLTRMNLRLSTLLWLDSAEMHSATFSASLRIGTITVTDSLTRSSFSGLRMVMKLKTEIEKVRKTKTRAMNDIDYSLLPSQLEKKYGVSKPPITAVAKKASPGRSKKKRFPTNPPNSVQRR